MVRMRLAALVLDPRTQPREEIDYGVVAEYREDMERGDTFPPVVAWGTEDRAYLSSGWHRYKARQQLGSGDIEVDLRPGGLDEAIWDSLSTNGDHGKRRTNADKRRAVRHALELRSELSNAEVARHCAVSANFVGVVRAEMEPTLIRLESARRLCADGRVIETKSIGRVPFYAPVVPSPVVYDDQRAEQEAAEAGEIIEDDDDGGVIERARLRVQFSHGMRAARELVMLRADVVADVLSTDQQPAVEAFCADMRRWCAALDAALRRPVRLVGGNDDP
jgi:hypothetical protein